MSASPHHLRVGGVPEHVNLPWHLALEAGAFARNGVDVDWSDQPAGTGAMMAALAEGSLDVAVALTEGVVAAIGGGLDATIVSVFVDSPLQWGVFAPSGVEPVIGAGARFAISRMGSGSHLMAHVLASSRGWGPVTDDAFVVVGGLDGARQALPAGDADLFLWDRFMTQPLVDRRVFQQVDTLPTPWPAFVIAVRNDVLTEQKGAVDRMVATATTSAALFEQRPDAADLVVERHHLGREVAAEWLSVTRWGTAEPPAPAMLDLVRTTLARTR